jgi:hypothetical protein
VAEIIRTLLTGLPVGRWCRVCSEPIEANDRFGLSEGVCEACRRD